MPFSIQKLFAVLLFSFCVCNSVSAQQKSMLAIINDADGYTNIRKGKSTHTEIVGTIDTGELFYCYPSTDSWLRVESLKQRADDTYPYGYISKNKIQVIDSLSNAQQKNIINNIFTLEAALYRKSNTQNIKWTGYHDSHFDVILKFYDKYFCKTVDSASLKVLFRVMCLENGSADEAPMWVAARCYVCQPAIVLDLVKDFKLKKDKELLYNAIEWGLQNIFYKKGDGDNEPTSKEYLQYKKSLDEARKSPSTNKLK